MSLSKEQMRRSHCLSRSVSPKYIYTSLTEKSSSHNGIGFKFDKDLRKSNCNCYEMLWSDFVSAHPDFDFQNIFGLPDGTICGIIDWDGVAAGSHSIGALS